MRVWTSGEVVQCGGISVGRNELRAIKNSNNVDIDIHYVRNPSFFAYRAIPPHQFQDQNGVPLGVTTISNITILNEILQGGMTQITETDSARISTEEFVKLTITEAKTPIPVTASAYLWSDVRYIYLGQNSTQYGVFTTTNSGVENEVFWGIDTANLEVLFSFDTGQVSVHDVSGLGGVLSFSVTRRIPAFNS